MVCEPHARFATHERFITADAILPAEPNAVSGQLNAAERAVAVVMNHDYAQDRACLEVLIASRARYIGMLGPRRRTERMLGELGMDTIDPRIHAPVGLALGAETPQEIALAIVCEIQSVLAEAPAVSLRDRGQSIRSASAAE